MAAYQTLFSISVKHDYFSDGLCACLDFVPTAATARILDNSGLLLRKTFSGITVLHDRDKQEALRAYVEDEAEPLCFEFKVYSNDPQFKSYSEPYGGADDALLCFDNVTDAAVTTGKIRLHASEYVSNMSFEKLDSLQVRDMLSQKDRLIPPAFVVKIHAHGKESALFPAQFETTAKEYYLRFKPRQTFWKYYLLGGMARKEAYIFDPDNGVEFEPYTAAMLPDTRPALVFRSKAAIPLRQKQNFRFQLREKGPGGEKVLIKRLPFASIGQYGKDVASEQGIVVSEIYINC